ncbi:SAF domain-containing protein [Nocardiopsis sp. CA-288880]|uniref:SAF domain-containing protein n=1 Tax=Nocardiopsis sp. CA-288880 TaxID=3239995 RepID=UPI003D995516
MTTTLSGPHVSERKTGRSRLSLPRRKGWKRPFAGVAAVVVGGVVAAWAAGHEEERVPMVVTAEDVAAGEALTIADLRIVPVLGVEDLDLAPVDEALGGRVAMPVPAGTVLTGAMLADTSGWPGPGQAVVAVQTQPGMLPASAREGALLLVLGSEEGGPHSVRLHSLGEEGDLAGSRVVELVVAEDEVAEVVGAVDEGVRMALMSAR